MLKTGYRGCGMSGVTGSAGAYYVGARTWPQLIGCALAQEPGVLNFGLRVANNGGRQICGDRKVSDCVLVDYKLRSVGDFAVDLIFFNESQLW